MNRRHINAEVPVRLVHVLEHGNEADFANWFNLWAWLQNYFREPSSALIGKLGDWQSVKIQDTTFSSGGECDANKNYREIREAIDKLEETP